MAHRDLRFYLTGLKAGKKEFFDPFYDQTKGAVWHTIYAIVKDRCAAEDLMQESYIAFLNHLQEIDERANPLAYLITTARNKALNELRRRNKEANSDPEDLPLPDPRDAYAEDEMPLWEKAREILSENEWNLLELCLIYGYKRVEAAKILKLPVSTVNWQYHNILKKIKKHYAEVYDET